MRIARSVFAFVFLFAAFISTPLFARIEEGTGSARNPLSDSPPSQAGQPALDFDGMVVKARSKGNVMVLVKLKVPPLQQTDGQIQEGQGARRDFITAASDALLRNLSGLKVTNVKRYSYVPFIALHADLPTLTALRADPNVEAIVEDVLLPPLLNVSVPLIGTPNAYAKGFSGAGQTVAVLDSGVDKTHPFLAGKVLSEACYSTNNAAYQVSSLCPGAVSQSTSSGSAAPCQYEGCEHGTHVAGIVAGKLESISGVARDANLIAINVFSLISDSNTCGGYRSTPCIRTLTSDQLLALERVRQLSGPYQIASVNMSLGGGQYRSHCDDNPLKPAIDALRGLGIATVIASGNSGYLDSLAAPACISSAVAVGSTEDGTGGPIDQVSDFSNSADFLDLLAPGGQILSSVPGAGGPGQRLSGTSMAAPHVAGAWAVLKSKLPSASVDQILAALRSTGKAVTDYRNGITVPRIRVDAAVDSLSGPDTTPPVITIDQPTADSSWTTDRSPVNISGAASDNVGVTQVIWSNNRGGSGTASLTASSWSAKDVALQNGTNIITVTASDAAGNKGSDTLSVTYNPPGCSYAISPTSRSHDSNAGSGSVSVTAGNGCAWSVLNSTAWITVTSGPSGTGNGSVTYSFTSNSSTTSRSGTLTIGGQTFTVTQQGASAGPVKAASGVPVYASVPANGSATACTMAQQQYAIDVPSGATQLVVALNGSQDLDLFVRKGQAVLQSGDNIEADISSETSLATETIYLGPQSTPQLAAATYYIGVANCPSAPGNFTLTATVITPATPIQVEELGVDDGNSETGLSGDGRIVVNRLVPSRYPSKLKAIRIEIWKYQNLPDPLNQQVKLIAFADSSGSGRPPDSPTLLVNQTVTVNGKYGFIEFLVANPPSISNGDWYVGFQYANPNNGVLASADTSGTARERSFYSDDGGTTFKGPLVFADNSKGNFTIRAVVESGLSPEMDTPVIDSATANFESDGSISLVLSGHDQGANVKSISEVRLDANGQSLGSGTFDVSLVTSGKTSFSFVINIGSGNRLSDTRQLAIKLIDSISLQSATWTASLTAGGTVSAVVPANGASTISTSGATGNLKSGYAAVQLSSGTTPYGTAVISYSQNGIVLSEVGVPSSPPTTSARVFIDFRTGVASGSGTISINTGFAVVNRGTSTANINYTLRDYRGATLASGSGTLASGAHRALFIDQMNQIAPNFRLPAGFSTSTRFATLDSVSDQPLSILALRLTTNQRGDSLLTSTPIADLTKTPPSGPLFFPQMVDGGGYRTSLILLNTSLATETGTVKLYDDYGSQFFVRQIGDSQAWATFNYSIQAGGFAILFTDGAPSGVNSGSVVVTPDAGTSTPIGAGVFSYAPGGIIVTESGVPAATLTTHARIYVDTSNSHDTGLAIANPNNSAANVTVRAFQLDGVTPAGSSSLPPLSAFGHTARFVGQWISGLPANFTGVLDISSSMPIAALTLRSCQSRDYLLTTFPMADVTQAAPSPILFPQIANGGGYKSQIILLGPGGAANASIGFFGDDGAAIVLTGPAAAETSPGTEYASPIGTAGSPGGPTG